MAYRFKITESLSQGVRRVYAEELSGAVGQLTQSNNRVAAVHEARKSIKKIRGLLSLLNTQLGGLYKQEDRYFRQAARALSSVRDNDVLLETFEHVVARHPDHDPRIVAELRNRLKTAARQSVEPKSGLAAYLEAARAHTQNWPIADLTLEQILPAVEKSYRKGRKALTRARQSESPEDFHELRKRAKEHWYHLRLFETPALAARLAALHDLESRLGDDHNLAILRQRLEAEAETMPGREPFRHVVHWLREDSQALREKALAAAQEIYAEKPVKYAEDLRAVWLPLAPKPSPAASESRAKSAVA